MIFTIDCFYCQIINNCVLCLKKYFKLINIYVILLFSEPYCTWLTQLDGLAQLDPAYCPNCAKMYKGPYRKRHLRQHLVYECGVVPKFRCYLCSKRFARNSQLKCHSFRIHKVIIS